MYTVKQLADLAGVSRRTLRYYDDIGLLKPARRGDNGYRYYDRQALLRLQQILFYREIGFSLSAIRQILDAPDFELEQALRNHRDALQRRIHRLERLVAAVDDTLAYLKGDPQVSEKQIFEPFSEEKQAAYAEQARQKYNPQIVDESMKRWKNYSPAQQQRILEEGNEIYNAICANMQHGATSAEVQAWIARWHQHLRNFYEPTPQMLRGLGQMYATSPDFRERLAALHPDLPDFLNAAIQAYCEGLP